MHKFIYGWGPDGQSDGVLLGPGQPGGGAASSWKASPASDWGGVNQGWGQPGKGAMDVAG